MVQFKTNRNIRRRACEETGDIAGKRLNSVSKRTPAVSPVFVVPLDAALV